MLGVPQEASAAGCSDKMGAAGGWRDVAGDGSMQAEQTSQFLVENPESS